MFNVCLRMVNRRDDAEDILQQSFIDVFSKLESFRFESSIGAWIKRIAVNNCINFLKKRRLSFQGLDDNLQSLKEEDSVEEIHLNVKAIDNALHELPDGFRIVFSLYMMEGYDHKEIGEILNITEATSKSQYSRAKKRLKELLEGQRMYV
jgi:RNA polymerase sigma-70 factor (ECF subfamily)